MPARRVRSDRPLTAAERQARYRTRYGEMNTALWWIAERAPSLDIARRVAADALAGHVDWTEYQPPGRVGQFDEASGTWGANLIFRDAPEQLIAHNDKARSSRKRH